MNLGLLHKKIVYDIINLSEVLPIKAKKIKDEKIFSFKAEEIKKIIFQGSIIENTSNKILEEIKDCIVTKLYEYVIKNEENKVKEKIRLIKQKYMIIKIKKIII